MQSLMMNTPLTITNIMRFAERVYGSSEIVSVASDNALHRYTYRDAFSRVRQLANALETFGVSAGDRVATLAWNDHRHFEIYYAVSCSGAVCHTINPRLFPEQIQYIANHAEDQWIFVDVDFVSMLESLQDDLPTVKGYIVLTNKADMPETTLSNVYCYEELLAGYEPVFEWPELEENTASSLCYTSGTTGNPKGVLYSHRSTVLHSYASVMPDSMCLSCRDIAMPIVPMFHVNAWGMAYSAPMVGAKLVLPGAQAGDGKAMADLINGEGVTFSLGVPTVWLTLLNYLRDAGKTVETLNRVVCGGSACPPATMDELRDAHGVKVIHVWGMTELSPLASCNNTLMRSTDNLSKEELDKIRAKVGRPVFGIEAKIVDDNDQELPMNGIDFGSLKVKGPWVISDYFRAEKQTLDDNGWLDTGDVATIDEAGYIQITDRKKDVIKSGGEWISSNDLENIAMAHPAVAEAGVIGVVHPKWDERPLLAVVKQRGEDVSKEELIAFYEGKIAKWWTPDDVVFVEALPYTATGKLSKKNLREQLKDFRFQE